MRKLIREEQRSDPYLATIIAALEAPPQSRLPEPAVDSKSDSDLEQSEQAVALTKYPKYRLGGDSLLAQSLVIKSIRGTATIWPLVLPKKLIPAILSLFHGDTSTLGHGGRHKTYGAIKRRFFWKGL